MHRLRPELGDHERVGGVVLVARTDHRGRDRDHRQQQRAQAEHPAGAQPAQAGAREVPRRRGLIGPPIAGRPGARPRPKRVNTTAHSTAVISATPTTTVPSVSGRTASSSAGASAQPPTSRIGLEQRHGRGGRHDSRRHQDDAGEHGCLDDVGPADRTRADAGGPESGHLGPAAPDLAGQPRQQVGQRDQSRRRRATSRASESARASGVAVELRPRRRRTSWPSPPPSLRSRASTPAGVSARATTTDFAPATVPTAPRSTRGEIEERPARPTNGTPPTEPDHVHRGGCRHRCPGGRRTNRSPGS